MYYGALPPEITSGKMYSGPGSGSMVAAAAVWDGLAAELRSAADSYGSIIAGLTNGSWLGPSSVSMAAAAAPYAAWMSATAAQAEQTASQARAAAAAYETAFAAVVPPPVITANRSQLASLVATNIFGQNTAAIAATEAQYGEMWAQDAAAMYGYAVQSAAASRVTPFAAAPATTNPGGLAGQLAATAQTAATSVGTSAQTQLSQFVSAVPTALQSLASTAAPAAPAPGLSVSQIAAIIETVPKLILPANDALITVIFGVAAGAKALTSAPAAALGALSAGLGSTAHVAGAAGVGAAAVSAGVGRAGMIGALSVPPSWASATPTIRLAASVLQGGGVGAAPAAITDGSGSLFGGMALAGMAGSALGAAAPRAVTGAVAKVGRPTVDKESKTPEKLKHALAEMSQTPESVQHWHTDEAHLESLLAQLSKKPGMHAVHLKKGKSGPPEAQSS
ncbi:MAG: PPE family protein [Mycobacterium sp.]